MDNKDKALKANPDQWDEFLESKCWKEMEEALNEWIEAERDEAAPQTQDDVIKAIVSPHIRDKLVAVKMLPYLTRDFLIQEQKDAENEEPKT